MTFRNHRSAGDLGRGTPGKAFDPSSGRGCSLYLSRQSLAKEDGFSRGKTQGRTRRGKGLDIDTGLDILLKAGVVLLLVFIPLYPKFPLANVAKTWVAIRWEDLLVAGVLIIWFLHQAKNGFPALKNRVSRLILLYWGVGLLSLVSALLLTKNVTPHLAALHFIRRVEYMSLFLVGLAAVKSYKNVKVFLGALFLATLGVVIYGFGQKYWGWPVVSTMNSEFSKGLLLQLTEWTRVSSTFAGHYDLATFLVLVTAVLMALLVAPLRFRLKIPVLALFAFSLYTLILTASRISFAAYLLAVSAVIVFSRKFIWLVPVLGLSLVMMLFSADITHRYALTFNIDLPAVSDKLAFLQRKPTPTPSPTPTPTPTPPPVVPPSSGGTGAAAPTPTPTDVPQEATASATQEWQPTTELAVQYSNAIRFQVEWPRALRALAKNPLLGTGYSSVTLATDNDYLRSLAETGLLGTLAFGLIFVEIGRRLVRSYLDSAWSYRKALIIGFGGATLGILANAAFIDVFEASKVAFIFWLLAGMMVKLMEVNQQDAKTQRI